MAQPRTPPGRAAFGGGLAIRILACAAPLCLAPAVADAAAIGEIPEKGLQGGLLAGLSHGDVDDPDGAVDAEIYLRLALLGAARLQANRRLLGEIFYHRYDTDPGGRAVGQDVRRLGAALSYQAKFPRWPLAPWAGAGLAYSSDRFEERVTVAADGFLDRRFPDRDDNTLALVLNATAQRAWIRGWDVGIHVQYEQPVSGDATTFTVAAVLLF